MNRRAAEFTRRRKCADGIYAAQPLHDRRAATGTIRYRHRSPLRSGDMPKVDSRTRAFLILALMTEFLSSYYFLAIGDVLPLNTGRASAPASADYFSASRRRFLLLRGGGAYSPINRNASLYAGGEEALMRARKRPRTCFNSREISGFPQER